MIESVFGIKVCTHIETNPFLGTYAGNRKEGGVQSEIGESGDGSAANK